MSLATVMTQHNDINHTSISSPVMLDTKNRVTIGLGIFSALCAVKAWLAFTKRPLPTWFDWLDSVFLCTIIFPSDHQPKRIGYWAVFTATYVAAKVAGIYGYKSIGGTMFGVLGVCSTLYVVLPGFKRPSKMPLNLSEGEKEPLLATTAGK